ncbi:glycosyltransferase [Flavobacterium sp. SM2513]|uniref:glycosyltransferase n=1 Tax=Flavobacterium sp. SM2513 TaxID=3424766 RepID=UPI003D7FD7C2
MVNQAKKTKIALVGYKLAKGGLERVFSTVSELLHDAGCEVSVIVLDDDIEYSYSGTLINLGHLSKFQKYFELKKQLKTNQFDYIIDFRHRINPWMELIFLHYIYSGFKIIYTIHSSKMDSYLTDNKWVAKEILQNGYKIIAVSNALNEKVKKVYGFEKGIVIPNAIAKNNSDLDYKEIQLPYKYCIAVGRLIASKQMGKLIETYSKSNLPNSEIHLVILGDGEEKLHLQKRIEELELCDFVHLLGFKKEVYSYMKNAEFLVLSSKHEGFSMVILEALNQSTPVISFDCETGPRELVQHGFNGLLVESQNFDALEKAMNRMIADAAFYKFCKENAKNSVNAFSAKTVGEKWLKLFNNNII